MQEKHEVIKERLRFVRERMKAENVDIFVVFTDDYHMSEYSGAYFADREYLSGFTGSAGTLAVTQTVFMWKRGGMRWKLLKTEKRIMRYFR